MCRLILGDDLIQRFFHVSRLSKILRKSRINRSLNHASDTKVGSLCQINRVKYLFDRRTLITIINSFVFSKLLYCSSVWANTTKKNIELLQTVQNFAARIVSGTRKFDHVTPILKQLQWLPIVKQLEVRDAIMVFKCLNGLAPPYLCQKFKTRSEVHNCNTRNRDRLHIPLCRTAAGQRSFTFRGQRLWNSLPDEFQSITNLDVFKVKIKQHFFKGIFGKLSFRCLIL